MNDFAFSPASPHTLICSLVMTDPRFKKKKKKRFNFDFNGFENSFPIVIQNHALMRDRSRIPKTLVTNSPITTAIHIIICLLLFLVLQEGNCTRSYELGLSMKRLSDVLALL